MKIMLIFPRPQYNILPQAAWLPLGLTGIASVLERDGHQVSIFDRYTAQYSIGKDTRAINQAMMERIEAFHPDLIGFNTVSPLIYDTAECVALIRRVFDGTIVAGGHHATAMPQLTLERIPGLDMVVAGEGEFPLHALAAGEDPSSIPGVWQQGTSHIPEAPKQIQDLDSLPFPAFHLVDYPLYTSRGVYAIRGHYVSSLSLLSSRGCVKRCEFCSESLTYGKGVRFHSPPYVVELMEKVRKDYRVEGIYFHDNDFLVNRNRVEELCKAIIDKGLQRHLIWAIQARAERIETGLVRLLQKAGCVLIEIGIEASSQTVLDQMKKDSTVAINEKAVGICRQQNMPVHAYMLTRVEGETVADLEQRLEWIKKIRPDSFSWHTLELHPGTALYLRLGRKFYEENPWSREAVEAFTHDDQISQIGPAIRWDWMKQHYDPLVKKARRREIFKRNSPERLMTYLMMKAGSRLAQPGIGNGGRL